jgi:hypothetical protein
VFRTGKEVALEKKSEQIYGVLPALPRNEKQSLETGGGG